MSATKQPLWRMVANLGDVDPIEHDGSFVYVDRRGIYPPELELLRRLVDDDDHSKAGKWELRRIVLDTCTYRNTEDDPHAFVLSDNKFHPDLPAWFADKIHDVARTCDIPGIVADLCSDDPIRLAWAYLSLADYFGADNFDSYPRIYNKRSELPRRIRRMRAGV